MGGARCIIMNPEVKFKTVCNSDISSLRKIEFFFNGNFWIEKPNTRHTDDIRGLIKPRIDFNKNKPPLI